MEQFARRPLTRRHYLPQHTAFLLREGNAKFGHGKSPSPQTTLRSEKENRPGSTCQSKIAKLLGSSRSEPCRGESVSVLADNAAPRHLYVERYGVARYGFNGQCTPLPSWSP